MDAAQHSIPLIADVRYRERTPTCDVGVPATDADTTQLDSWIGFKSATPVGGYWECKVGDFPVSKSFSPYIHAISRKA